jgi:GYD domain
MGTVTALVIGFAAPAMAQQPMRHYLAPSGEYDGFAVFEFPDDVTAAASVALTRSSGNFQNNESMPILNADEFKAAMQKAKDVRATTAYTAPMQTK